MSSFKPNRDLLNPHFEGYKLAGNNLTSWKQNFPGGVLKIVPPADKFSYQFVREATMKNHLVSDPWNGFRVYWCTHQTPHKLLCGSILNSQELIISTVYQFDTPAVSTDSLADINSSIHFLSPTLSLFYHLSISRGHLLLFNTGNDESSPPAQNEIPPSWRIIASIPLINPNVTIQSARLCDDEVHFMTFDLQESDDKMAVECGWWKFSVANITGTGSGIISDVVDQTLCCSFRTSTIPLHSEFVGSCLVVITESTIESKLVSKTKREEQESSNVRETFDDSVQTYPGIGYQDTSKYSWTQSGTDVTVLVSLPEDVTKRDVVCDIKEKSLIIGLTDGTSYIRGDLYSRIDKDVSTWVFTQGRLEVTLEKLHANKEWISLLNDGSAAATTADDLPLREGLDYEHLSTEEIEELKTKIKNLTGKRESTVNDTSSSKRSKPIVQTTYEECDTEDDNDTSIYAIRSNGAISQKIKLTGKQLLFTSPFISIKHDIDALLFEISISHDNSSILLTHTGTFHALGYVQASKKDKKFLTCTSDGSYAVLSDSSRHVFIYCQPTDVIKGISALQYVYTLDENDIILGLQVTIEKLVYVLLEETLVVLKLY